MRPRIADHAVAALEPPRWRQSRGRGLSRGIMYLALLPGSRASVGPSTARSFLLAACLAGSLVTEASAVEQGSASRQASGLSFDIPVQPLVSALDAYATVTGREVFYDGALVLGRQSTKVNGVLPPDVALRVLLQGTDFVPHATGSHSFTITPMPQPAVAPTRLVISGGDGGYEPYFTTLQADLRQALCRSSETQPGRYQLVIRLWLTPSGAVERAELLSSTGNRTRDGAFAAALQSVRASTPPPAGLPQPVTMVVFPRPSGDAEECSALHANSEGN
jgi:TonB family protein